MTASNNPLKSNQSNNIAEVMPQELVKMIAPLSSGVKEIIYDCSFDAGDVDDKKQSVWLKQPATGYTLFGISSLKKQILALVEYAGPLDQIETYIRQAHTRQEAHLQTTLMQAITLSVKGLDQTIRDEKGTALDEGMAERLLMLHEELFPNDQAKALKQAKLAAPLEDEKAKKSREEANIAAMEQLFAAFVQNDKDALPAAIETFKAFVKSLKPREVTNNRYYLNLMHLIFAASDILARRGNNLPSVDKNDEGKWYGKLGDSFCFKIIGGTLQYDLPPRIQQILKSGLYHFPSKPTRVLDVSGALFRGDGTNYPLGISFYYDSGAPRYWGHKIAELRETNGDVEYFKTYYKRLCQHPKFIIQQPQAQSACRCLIM